MNYRKFGRTNVTISEVGQGTWTMGSMWGPRDDRAAIDSLLRSLELGVTFIDTAWIYGDGHSEELISSALKQMRTKVFVATKVPPKNLAWPAKPDIPVSQTFPADHIIDYTEKSLKNLRMDCVDLQQLHVWQDFWLKDLEWLSAVEKLKKEGKIRFFGISINDHAPNSALEAVKSGLIDSVQVIYNIFDQSPEEKLFPLCIEKNVAVIARVPFDEGSLTGTFTKDMTFHKKDWRKNYFTPDRLEEVCARVERVKKIAESENVSMPALALKFCLANPAVSVVIPGMRKTAHIDECVNVSDGKTLKPETLVALKQEIWLRNFYSQHG